MQPFRPPPPEAVDIAGPAGLLETLVEAPAAASGDRVAVVCHPHPLHGGTMHNKVVHMVARGLQMLGVPTARFNYRGVGRSEGSYADGVGETEDAAAIVDWMGRRWPRAVTWVAGFSFGAGVALRVTAVREVARLITVAPAVDRLGEPVAVPDCPWLVIHGSRDELIPCAAVESWVAGLSPAPRLEIMDGADHFFHGRLSELRDRVIEWAG